MSEARPVPRRGRGARFATCAGHPSDGARDGKEQKTSIVSRKRIWGVALAALALAAAPAMAALVVYESFNYTAGTTNPDPDGGVNSGNGLPYTNVGGNPSGTSTGLRNSWSSDATVASGSLAYSGIPTSDNSLFLVGGKQYNPSQVYLYRNMTTDPFQAYRGESTNGFGADGQTVWGSMLLQMGGIGSSDRFALYLMGFDEGTYNRITIATYGGSNWGVALQDGSANNAPGSSVTVNSPVAPTTNVTLLVWKHEFGSGVETFSLWFNPNLSSLGTANYVLNTGREVGFGGIGWDTRNGAGSTIDEIRIGTEMVDVIPEPSTIGLSFLGVFAARFLRRRRA